VVDGTLGTVKVQFVKLMSGTLDGTEKAAVGANGLAVNDAAANLALGVKTDAKNTATDTTSVSGISIWKQISASIQAAATSLTGTLTVATHAVTGAT